MSTTELQNNIIRKILNTRNDQLLDYVDQLLSKEEMNIPYTLSNFEMNIIMESLSDYSKGSTSSDKDVSDKIEKWLDD